jgi:porin
VASAFLNEKLNSRGINIGRQLRGRKRDNIGIGYGYLDGGNMSVDKTQVVEGYVRFVLNEYVSLTLDAQYMDDKYVPDEGTNVDGWIVGARMTVEF